MSILNELNEHQRVAAGTLEGPLLILAGAGSGKTRTVTYRIAHMVLEKGISPYKILAVTFTNKAAKEMKERVERLIGDDASKTTVATFHSFGMRLLRIYADKIGYDSNFTIYDTDDQKKVIKNLMKSVVPEGIEIKDSYVAAIISSCKEEEITPDEYEKENNTNPKAIYIAELYRKYNMTLKNNNGMDFSDILTNTYKLLNVPEVFDRIVEKYHYIMVDEYQDTNEIQYRIIKKLASVRKNICVVGDENQSIYGFRGANIKNILDFEKDYPNAVVVKLEENYRSTSVILDAANAVIKNNKSSRDKKLWTKKAKGDLIQVAHLGDGRQEAEFVVDKITDIKSEENKSYSDFTILYRTNAQSRNFEEAFRKNRIPYKVFGGMQFYQRAEIKDILAYLSFVNNSRDGINLMRVINVPKRKIGDKTFEKLLLSANEKNISTLEAMRTAGEISGIGPAVAVAFKEFYDLITKLQAMVYEQRKVSEIFEALIISLRYEDYLKSNYGDEDGADRIRNVDELRTSIVEYEKVIDHLTLQEYLESTALVSATDDLDASAEYVKLMTIHNSKGLEFPIVFLAGVEDEIFPNTSKVEIDPNALEEERRLCYVAITRAEEKLFISYADSRYMYGDTVYRTKSRFLEEIPLECLNEEDNEIKKVVQPVFIDRDTYIEPKRKSLDNLNFTSTKVDSGNFAFKNGEKVFHRKFGLGIVRGMDEKKVIVEFVDGRKEIASVLAEKFLTKS